MINIVSKTCCVQHYVQTKFFCCQQVFKSQVQVQVQVLMIQVRVQVQVPRSCTRVQLEYKYKYQVLQALLVTQQGTPRNTKQVRLRKPRVVENNVSERTRHRNLSAGVSEIKEFFESHSNNSILEFTQSNF